jgi:large subunit ribosomal protein L30
MTGLLKRIKEKVTGHKTIRIRQVRSGIGCPVEMRETLKALGLGKLHRIAERVDTPEVRGMIAKIPHLVEVVRD